MQDTLTKIAEWNGITVVICFHSMAVYWDYRILLGIKCCFCLQMLLYITFLFADSVQ